LGYSLSTEEVILLITQFPLSGEEQWGGRVLFLSLFFLLFYSSLILEGKKFPSCKFKHSATSDLALSYVCKASKGSILSEGFLLLGTPPSGKLNAYDVLCAKKDKECYVWENSIPSTQYAKKGGRLGAIVQDRPGYKIN
jgi:hypothetical protein